MMNVDAKQKNNKKKKDFSRPTSLMNNSVVKQVLRGSCKECECSGYNSAQGKEGGACTQCGHFPSQHEFLGKVSLSEQELLQEKAYQQAHTLMVGTPFKEKDISGNTKGGIYGMTATDEKGRKRFHGAFEGGFSAGYFNTVGSKEGFVPSTFKSSRSDRAQVVQQKSDFMDEEDLQAEFSRGLEKNNQSSDSDQSRSGTSHLPLQQFFSLSQDSIGVQLLKTMGWKEGQALSSRVQSVAQEAKAKLEQLHRTDDFDEKLERQLLNEILNRPKEGSVARISFAPKDNAFGLGYVADPQDTLDHRERLVERTQTSNRMMMTTNFGPSSGLGSLEDDEEIFNDRIDPKNSELYDKELSEEAPRIMFKKPQQHKQSVHQAPFSSKKSGDSSKQSLVCHDGNPPLPGFFLSSQPLGVEKSFPAPHVPPDYNPTMFSSAIPTSEGQFTPSEGLFMNSIQRAKLLGEEPLPTTQKKVLTQEEHKKVFEDANQRFKPLAQGLASRFSSVGAEVTKQQEEPLRVIDFSKKARESSENPSPATQQPTENEVTNLTRISVTRTISDFFPENVVCKRFGLKNPHKKKKKPEPQSQKSGLDSLPTQFAGRATLYDQQTDEADNNNPKLGEEQQKQKKTYNPLEDASDEDDDPLEPYEKPSIDLFKEIFENSSDDEQDPVKNSPRTIDPSGEDPQGSFSKDDTSKTLSKAHLVEKNQTSLRENPTPQKSQNSIVARNIMRTIEEEAEQISQANSVPQQIPTASVNEDMEEELFEFKSKAKAKQSNNRKNMRRHI